MDFLKRTKIVFKCFQTRYFIIMTRKCPQIGVWQYVFVFWSIKWALNRDCRCQCISGKHQNLLQKGKKRQLFRKFPRLFFRFQTCSVCYWSHKQNVQSNNFGSLYFPKVCWIWVNKTQNQYPCNNFYFWKIFYIIVLMQFFSYLYLYY